MCEISPLIDDGPELHGCHPAARKVASLQDSGGVAPSLVVAGLGRFSRRRGLGGHVPQHQPALQQDGHLILDGECMEPLYLPAVSSWMLFGPHRRLCERAWWSKGQAPAQAVAGLDALVARVEAAITILYQVMA